MVESKPVKQEVSPYKVSALGIAIGTSVMINKYSDGLMNKVASLIEMLYRSPTYLPTYLVGIPISTFIHSLLMH